MGRPEQVHSVLRGLRYTFIGLLASALIALLGSAAAQAMAAQDDAVAAAESVALSFTDTAGNPHDRPYFDVTNSHPGMPEHVTTVTLSNEGTMSVEHELALVLTQTSEPPGLGEVLQVTVSDQGQVLYRGALAELRVSGAAPIAPAASVTYTMAVTWPDGGASDNQYQGASIEFDLVARSRESIG